MTRAGVVMRPSYCKFRHSDARAPIGGSKVPCHRCINVKPFLLFSCYYTIGQFAKNVLGWPWSELSHYSIGCMHLFFV